MVRKCSTVPISLSYTTPLRNGPEVALNCPCPYPTLLPSEMVRRWRLTAHVLILHYSPQKPHERHVPSTNALPPHAQLSLSLHTHCAHSRSLSLFSHSLSHSVWADLVDPHEGGLEEHLGAAHTLHSQAELVVRGRGCVCARGTTGHAATRRRAQRPLRRLGVHCAHHVFHVRWCRCRVSLAVLITIQLDHGINKTSLLLRVFDKPYN
jgi:hypothetical protein